MPTIQIRNAAALADDLPPLDVVETRTPEQLIADGDAPRCPHCIIMGHLAEHQRLVYAGGDYWKCPGPSPSVACDYRKLTAQAAQREANRLKLLDDATIGRLTVGEGLPALLNAEPLTITMPANVAFLMHQYLAITLMGKAGAGPNGLLIRKLAERIERAVFTSPLLMEIARRGWAQVDAAHGKAPLKIWQPPHI